jgi:hypothetical protein
MKTRAELRTEIVRILGYELQPDEFTQAQLNQAIQDAYSIVCELAEQPILTRGTTYKPSVISNAWGNYKVYNISTMAETGEPTLDGINRIYRAWWKAEQATGNGSVPQTDWYELKPGIYTEPEYDEVFTEQMKRVVPSPLNETRLTIPRIKLLSQTAGTDQNGIPFSFVFVDNHIIFDKHPTNTNQVCKLRVLASFKPSLATNAAVPQLTTDATRTMVSELLDYAIIYYAIAILIVPYADLLEYRNYLTNQATELITLSKNHIMHLVLYSPTGVLEATSGLTLPTEEAQPTNTRRQKR